jgi:hypothetical protein
VRVRAKKFARAAGCLIYSLTRAGAWSGAMVALARRAKEGGSWLVRISLAQVGRWLVDRGEVPEAALKDVPKEIPQADIDR